MEPKEFLGEPPVRLLGKTQILGADDLPTEDVPVPEWAPKGDPNPGAWMVRLKTLTGTERDAFEASTIEMKGNKQTQNLRNLRARLVARCIVNDKGVREFADADIAALGRKSAKCLDRLFDKCQEMSGLSDEDVEKLSEGFDDAPSEDSISD